MVCGGRALAAFKLEGAGDDCDRQDAHFLGYLCHHRCGTGASATAHASGDEHHIRPLQHVADAVAVFKCGLSTNLGIRTRTQPLGNVATQLQHRFAARTFERLCIRIGAHEVHPFDLRAEHVLHSIAATTTHTDHLDDRRFAISMH